MDFFSLLLPHGRTSVQTAAPPMARPCVWVGFVGAFPPFRSERICDLNATCGKHCWWMFRRWFPDRNSAIVFETPGQQESQESQKTIANFLSGSHVLYTCQPCLPQVAFKSQIRSMIFDDFRWFFNEFSLIFQRFLNDFQWFFIDFTKIVDAASLIKELSTREESCPQAFKPTKSES